MPRVMTAEAFWSEFYITELNQFAKNEGLDVTIIDQPGPKLATKDGRVVRELEEAELKDFLVRWTNELMEGEGYDIRVKVDENGEIHTYRVKPKLVSMNGGGNGHV
jgi:hypothetical protein